MDNCSCEDFDDTFYTAVDEGSSLFEIDDEEDRCIRDPAEIVEELRVQEEAARSADHVLADKLDEMASALRGGSARSTPPLEKSCPMPLKEVLAAVEKRLKEKLREDKSLLKGGKEECIGRTQQGRGQRCPRNAAHIERNSALTKQREEPRCQAETPRSSKPPSGLCQRKHSPSKKPVYIEPDYKRFQLLYDPDEIVCDPCDKTLQGNVQDIRIRRKMQQRNIPRSKIPIRQLKAIPVESEEYPDDQYEFLGVKTPEYRPKQRSPTPVRRPLAKQMPRNMPQPRIFHQPLISDYDPMDQEWYKMKEGVRAKTYGEIMEEKRLQEEDPMDKFVRYAFNLPSSTPKKSCKAVKQQPWEYTPSPGRMHTFSPQPSHRPGPPLQYAMEVKRNQGRRRTEERLSSITPPQSFYEIDEIDECDVSI